MKKIGLIFADEQEFLPFVKYAQNKAVNAESFNKYGFNCFSCSCGKVQLIALHSGIGKVNAAAAASALILGFGVQTVLNAGLSGAVSGVMREDIVAGETYIECDFDLTAIGYKLGEKPGEEVLYKADSFLLESALKVKCANVKKCSLGTGDIFLADKVKKDLYKETFAVGAFDMESAAIACVCKKNSVPFLSVRKISDNADDMSVETYTEMNNRQEAALSEIVFEIAESL